jgi:hypothetical protein
MNRATAAIIASLMNFTFEIWRTHSGKPDGWKPTPEDIAALLNEVSAATPTAEKQAAAERLGVEYRPME